MSTIRCKGINEALDLTDLQQNEIGILCGLGRIREQLYESCSDDVGDDSMNID